jgi:hypothetical protein
MKAGKFNWPYENRTQNFGLHCIVAQVNLTLTLDVRVYTVTPARIKHK